MEYIMSAAFLPFVIIIVLVVFCLRFSKNQNATTVEYFKSFSNNKSGQDLIEYAVMAGFVAVVAGAIVPSIAKAVKASFGKINTIMAQSSLEEVCVVPTMNFDIDIVRIICAILAIYFIYHLTILRQHRQWGGKN